MGSVASECPSQHWRLALNDVSPKEDREAALNISALSWCFSVTETHQGSIKHRMFASQNVSYS